MRATVLLLALLSGSALASAAAPPAPAPTLYERLGGTYPIAAMVDDFVERLLYNSVLDENPWLREAFAKTDKAGLKYRITSLVCQAAGGPEKYAGRTMFESHKHLYVREEDWAALAQEFQASLDRFLVPRKEQQELFAIVGSLKKDIVLSGELDGKTFVGICGGDGRGEESAQISFRLGRAKLDALVRSGFGSGIYRTEKKGAGVSFTFTCATASGETMAWTGAWEAESLEASAVRSQPGKPAATWWFKGNLSRPQ